MAVWRSGYAVLFLCLLLMSVFGLRGFGKQYFFSNLFVLFTCLPLSHVFIIISQLLFQAG